jgi:bifunctional oligoribonuclease and PAP phosphatase NrnA
MNLNNIISAIKAAKTIAILPHIYADGDSLGSSLALNMTLQKMGKNTSVFIEEPIPFIYDFLPESKAVQLFSGNNQIFDLVIALDTGDLGRLGKRIEIFDNAKITVNIDHHFTNSEFAFHNYIDSNSSAVGEIIYQLINMMDQKLDSEIATCLYVAIATDTGGFRFSNTTAVTHQIVADLIGNNVNVSEISQKVFDTVTHGKVKVLGEAIKSLELLEYGKLAVLTLSDEIIKNIGAKDEDCDGIINTGRNINGVEVAILLRVKENGEIKVNLRSKSYVDVGAIANMYSGGGHKRAAGCTVQGNPEDVKKRLIDDIKEVI